jgi:hypothetical protein
LHDVIPIFDILTCALDDFVDDESNLLAVRSAARCGRATMNKYYGITDESVMYRISMSTSSNSGREINLTFHISPSSTIQVVLFSQGEMATRSDNDSRNYILR